SVVVGLRRLRHLPRHRGGHRAVLLGSRGHRAPAPVRSAVLPREPAHLWSSDPMSTSTPSVGLLVPPDVMAQTPERRQRYLEHVADAGVDHLAVGDHVSFHVGVGFDGLIHATALLTSQVRLPVTVAVYLLALRHPVTVARSLASIDELARG